ncbi:cytochrome c oxidase subunit 4 [Protofrankia symbiont of Coriaria ruscifolia]|uniref:cytochrome c oxidase subunit 4 n=1 Tax=Protofrankia symbiont of Coriaria ruscifolia TaxID=1306542 RepID=UPI001041825B|nr:cytochrome c oxidase subunit 4 [Protofrankia symbiont of Coriaria ruscifolia]
MKIEGVVFLVFTIFCAVVDVVYWFTSQDPTGTVALALCGSLGLLVGGYLLFTARRIGARPQDLPDAEVADGAGELGHFTPGSYYPFFIAISASLVVFGIIFGVWLGLIGGIMTLFFVVCLLFENLWHPPVPED